MSAVPSTAVLSWQRQLHFSFFAKSLQLENIQISPGRYNSYDLSVVLFCSYLLHTAHRFVSRFCFRNCVERSNELLLQHCKIALQCDVLSGIPTCLSNAFTEQREVVQWCRSSSRASPASILTMGSGGWNVWTAL